MKWIQIHSLVTFLEDSEQDFKRRFEECTGCLSTCCKSLEGESIKNNFRKVYRSVFHYWLVV
ncbi:hypothetical protein L484_007191 [Morus notabilis]|uniref:Uncharacterized protein n=1 Tax=Morus notabilis TaxID=981085 RepID=W9QSE9_9ROSA|nr:hypothetical protein L484_007191 [Morus notabilis]